MEERTRERKGVTLLDIAGGSWRNHLCICRSGRKLKRCCGTREVVLNEVCHHGDQIVALAPVDEANNVLIMSRCPECVYQLGNGIHRYAEERRHAAAQDAVIAAAD
jgi:hypothetical protein